VVWMKWTGSKERGSYKAFRWVRVGKKRRRRQVDLGRDERVAKKKLAEIEAAGIGEDVTLELLTARYLTHLEAEGCAQSYVDRVHIVLRHLARINPGVRVSRINSEAMDEYKLKRRAEKIDPETINREVGIIKAAVKKAKRFGFTVADLADVGKVRVAEKDKSGFAHAEVRTLLESATDDTTRVLLHLGLYFGLRRSEIVSLKWADVDFDGRKLTLGKTWKTKTGELRALPISKRSEAFLRTWRDGQCPQPRPVDPVLPHSGSPTLLTTRFSQFVRRLGLTGSIHKLRHTYVTALAQKAAAQKVQKLAGHASIKTTERYTHLSVEDLREAMEDLDYE